MFRILNWVLMTKTEHQKFVNMLNHYDAALKDAFTQIPDLKGLTLFDSRTRPEVSFDHYGVASVKSYNVEPDQPING